MFLAISVVAGAFPRADDLVMWAAAVEEHAPVNGDALVMLNEAHVVGTWYRWRRGLIYQYEDKNPVMWRVSSPAAECVTILPNYDYHFSSVFKQNGQGR
jgi:hypothetical protein